jgi:hypothetical protein
VSVYKAMLQLTYVVFVNVNSSSLTQGVMADVVCAVFAENS